MESYKVFDLQSALDRLDNDEELLSELVELLWQTTPESLQQLHAALASSDAEQLEFVAHSLKSACGNVGAMTSYSAAMKLEKTGKSKDLSVAPAILQELEEELKKFKSEFAASGIKGASKT